MVFRTGRLSLPSVEYFEELIKKGILAEYDVSPGARELHDAEVALKYMKQYYSHLERAKAWREAPSKKEKKVTLDNFMCVNPWIVGGE